MNDRNITYDNTARDTSTSKAEGRLKFNVANKKKKILDNYLKNKRKKYG